MGIHRKGDREAKGEAILREAILAVRADAERAEQLSDRARAAVFATASRGSAPTQPLARLFAPVRQWALVGAVPVLVTALAAALLVTGLPGPADPNGSAAPVLRASKVGDEVVFDGLHVQGKLFIHALYSMLPKVFAMRYGADFPWLQDKDRSTHACPDAHSPVVFEIRRIGQDSQEG